MTPDPTRTWALLPQPNLFGRGSIGKLQIGKSQISKSANRLSQIAIRYSSIRSFVHS
jgi:hypothetical protein